MISVVILLARHVSTVKTLGSTFRPKAVARIVFATGRLCLRSSITLVGVKDSLSISPIHAPEKQISNGEIGNERKTAPRTPGLRAVAKTTRILFAARSHKASLAAA